MSDDRSSAVLPQWLGDLLACPDTHHTRLTYDAFAQTLTCPTCRRVFPVRDGVPVLLLSEATGGEAA